MSDWVISLGGFIVVVVAVALVAFAVGAVLT